MASRRFRIRSAASAGLSAALLLALPAGLSAQAVEQIGVLSERNRAALGSGPEEARQKADFDRASGRGAAVPVNAGAEPRAARRLTLAEKAERLQELTDARHRPWFGLVVSRKLKEDGSLLEYKSISDAAIWTGNYVAAQAYRYAATQDPRALAAMEDSLRGLVALHAVTGVPGLFARVIVPKEYAQAHGFIGRKEWHAGAGRFEGWYWKGDLSRDQYAGYLFGLCAAWPHIQDPKLRAAVRDTARKIGEHVINNDMRIISEDTFLDFRGNYFYQDRWPAPLRKIPMPPLRAGNAMHGLHLMKVVTHITGEPRFEDYYLRRMMGEAEMDVHLKRYGPFYADQVLRRNLGLANAAAALYYGSGVKVTPESMRSDVSQNLSHMAMHDLLVLEDDPDLRELYAEVFCKIHRVSERDGNTYWNFLYARHEPDPRGVAEGADSLRRFPETNRFDRVENSADPALAKYKGVHKNAYKNGHEGWGWFSEQPLPFEKRVLHPSFAWQHNPYQLDGGEDGVEGSGTAYLVAYWMGRAQGFIGPLE